MKQKSILLGLVMGLTLVSQDTQSLGMGAIQVHSALDQPLQASIDLMMGDGEDLSNLSVKLANAADYKKVGLDRSFVPSNITVAVDEDNPLLIRVSSAGPVSEPIVTLLLDVNWANGRIYREFTILLDPPVYSSSEIVNGSSVYTGNTTSSDDYVESEPVEEVVEAPAPEVQTRAEAEAETYADTEVEEEYVPEEATEEVVAEEVSEEPSYEPVASGSVEVMSGDTLWSLANQNKPSELTTNQMMAALFNNNPQAFTNNNINQLVKGSRLMIPTASDLQSISQADALDLVQSHNSSWAPSQASEDSYSSFQTSEPAYVEPAEETTDNIDYGVELAGSTDQEDSNGGEEGGGYENLNENAVAEELYNKDSENEDLKSRLSELEGIVVQQQEALEIKSDDLANLEDQLTETPDSSSSEDELMNEEGVSEETIAAGEVSDETVAEGDDVWGDDARVALTDEEMAATAEESTLVEDITSDEVSGDIEPEVVEEAVVTPKTKSPSFSGAQNKEESFVDKSVNWVMSNLQWLAIGLGGLLVLLFVPKFFRSRDKDVGEETSFLDDIKTRNNEKDGSEEVVMSNDESDTKVNTPLKEDSDESEVSDADDVLADLDKEIDFESDEDEDEDEDIFKGFDDDQDDVDLNDDAETSEDEGFDLDGFLNDDEESEVEKSEDKQEEDFDFDLSELDDLEDGTESNDLTDDIDDTIESLADDADDAIEEVAEEIAEKVEVESPDFSIDEDFEFDLDSELADLSDDAEDAVEEIAEESADDFDEVLDIAEDSAESLEVATDVDDSEIDLGLDLDDMLEDGDVIDTKFDLAKAYLEMGDKDGAKNLLKEVTAEGNEAQIEKAKKLLDDM